jgi:hypothetical protein
MMHNSKVQKNVFSLVQIFNAIPPPSFSAPAELRIINPTTDPYIMLILIPYFLIYGAQYMLGVRQSRIPSKDGFGRLGMLGRNHQCRSDIFLHLDLHLTSLQFGIGPKNTSSF